MDYRKDARTPVIHTIVVALLLLTGNGVSAATLTEHMDIGCRQPDPLRLTCDYRMLSDETLVSATAERAGTISAGVIDDTRPDSSKTAVLFLVDTSDPARAAVVEKARGHILRIVAQAQAHHVFAIAAFDSNLEMICDFPCSGDAIETGVAALVAKGRTTELYRNVLEAIKRIKAVPAERHLIVIMSDGLAEDLAYHHEDVIAAARADEVVITSMGYPRSVAQSIALQTLRRLSEETGGLFAQASHIDNEIPAGFFSRVLSAIDNGGTVDFDLSSLDATGPIDLSLAFQTTERNFLVLVPVRMPEPEPVAIPAPPAAPALPVVPAAAPPAGQRPAAVPELADSKWSWFWYGLPAMIFSVILAAAVLYAMVTKRRREEQRLQVVENSAAHAFLVSAYDENQRYKIDHTPWRIGRSRNNELPLNDTSVSRLHGEIRRDALGQFTIQDLESLNGVFVNGEAVDMAHLDEGDRVEIGDVGFVFTFHDEDYSRQEPTVLVSTRSPT